jgi:hypothetical protein
VVIAAYISASDTQRETIRRAFSGFKWVGWQVSNFAARQSQSLDVAKSDGGAPQRVRGRVHPRSDRFAG